MLLRYAVLAERITLNAQGQLTIDGTIENAILPRNEPFVTPPFYVAGALVAEPDEGRVHSLSIVVPHPNGGEILRFTPLPNINFGKIGQGAFEKLVVPFGTILPQLQLPGVGRYEFQVAVDDVTLGAATLYAVVGQDARSPVSDLPTGLRERSDQATVADVLRRTRETLQSAQMAAQEVRGAAEPARKLAALSNVVVWGRAVTNVLQGLRSVLPNGAFDAWYEPWRREMDADPLLKYLYRLRSQLLKTGERPPMSVRGEMRNFHPDRDLPPPPPNAVGFFVGDQLGGSGWEVRLPDGTMDKIYVRLPEGTARAVLNIDDLPEWHLGSRIEDRSVEHVSTLFLHYLERIVYTAEHELGGQHRGVE